ncbi:MAG: hypothetical protein KKB20_28525 [Proteobacteria bacterium]|nr:hypothetical protein [Pseudomonadota bacterium]
MPDPYTPPFSRPPRYRRRWPWALALFLVFITLALNHVYQWYPWPGRETAPPPPSPPPSVASTPAQPSVIDFGKLEDGSDLALGEMILKRKREFGLKDSVDMVVKPEESIRIGKETVPLSQIVAAIKEQQEQNGSDVPRPSDRGVREEDLTRKSSRPPSPPPTTSVTKSAAYYGVYVVRPGDNLWDIHFNFLREYFRHRGIEISSTADEPKAGRSTGIGRILKYAETMVHIFNMKTKMLDKKLDLLEPQQKVVVFNLTRLGAILGALDASKINQVQYDGRDIHLPE